MGTSNNISTSKASLKNIIFVGLKCCSDYLFFRIWVFGEALFETIDVFK